MTKNRILILGCVGAFAFADAIYEIFFEGGILGSKPLAWVLLGPGLGGGPAMVWVAWRKYLEFKRQNGPATKLVTLKSDD